MSTLIHVQSIAPRDVQALSAAINVSTRTQLMAFTNLLNSYTKLMIGVLNLSTTDPVTVIIETSENGVNEDVGEIQLIAPPEQSAMIEVNDSLKKFWAIYAQTDSPFPTASVKWFLRAVPRLPAMP